MGFSRYPTLKECICCDRNWYIKRKESKRLLAEVEVMRVKITLACTECKQRNYNMTKDKKTHPDRMETKKYCRFCQRHTMHKETK